MTVSFSSLNPRLRELIAMHGDQPLQAVSAQQRLAEDLRIDSLAMAALLLDIEDAFGVVVDAGKLARVVTVSDMEQAVQDLIVAAAA